MPFDTLSLVRKIVERVLKLYAGSPIESNHAASPHRLKTKPPQKSRRLCTFYFLQELPWVTVLYRQFERCHMNIPPFISKAL